MDSTSVAVEGAVADVWVQGGGAAGADEISGVGFSGGGEGAEKDGEERESEEERLFSFHGGTVVTVMEDMLHLSGRRD